VEDHLSYPLRHGRTARQQSRDALIARLTAKHVLEHLERSTYVVMQKPPARAHSPDLPVANPQRRD